MSDELIVYQMGGVGVVGGCWDEWCAGEGCCGWWKEGGWCAMGIIIFQGVLTKLIFLMKFLHLSKFIYLMQDLKHEHQSIFPLWGRVKLNFRDRY